MEFQFIDEFLESHDHCLPRCLFDILVEPYYNMEIKRIGGSGNKVFYHLRVKDSNWHNNVIVEEENIEEE